MTDRPDLSPAGATAVDITRFAWLNEPGTRVEAWVDQENARTSAHLDSLPGIDALRADLTAIVGAEHRSLPKEAGGKLFQLRRLPGEAQHSLWVSDASGERVLVSATELESETDSIAAFSPAPDGERVVWTVSAGGADWQLARVRAVATGRDQADVLTGLKWPDLAWLDDTSFAYMSWEMPPAGEELTALNSGARIRVHTLGTSQADDPEVYAPAETTWVIPTVSADRKWLLLEQMKGIVPATVLRRPLPLNEQDTWETVLDDTGPDSLIGVFDGAPLVLSYRGCSAGQLLVLEGPGAARNDGSVSAAARRVYRAADEAPLADAVQAGDHAVLVAHTLTGTQLTTVRLSDGQLESTVTLPASHVLQSIAGCGTASVAVDIEVIGGERTVSVVGLADLAGLAAGTPSPLAVELHWVPSADGTKVPMRVVRTPGPTPAGDARVFLSVYGGYAVPFATNGFNAWHLAWINAGGVLAYAGVRGGGELGESWHQAARRDRKMRGIEDLIACAEWFETEGWSGPRQVAINGMSNGGLMTAAALVQRPEFFGAVITEVPVADMLNFHRYTAAHGWVAEYGDPEHPGDREFLAEYSPLHNVRPELRYAPTLVLTADKDDRVPPGPHAYPLAAALRETVHGDDTTFLGVTRNAGHATGRSLRDTVAERSAVLGFAGWGTSLLTPSHTNGNGDAS